MSYVYLIEFIPTGQMYIGSRWAKGSNPDELLNAEYNRTTTNSQPFSGGYWTSSKFVHKLMRQHGQHSFRVIFAVECVDALHVETQLLVSNNVSRSNLFLNAHANEDKIWSSTGHKWINNGIIERYIMPDDGLPEGWNPGRLPSSEETKRKKGRPGKVWATNGHEDTMVYPNHIPPGYVLGRSADFTGTKKLTTTCEYCGVTGGAANMERYHHQNCKMKTFKETGDAKVFKTGKLSFTKCKTCHEYHHKTVTCPNCPAV